jgi:hypothetical protein
MARFISAKVAEITLRKEQENRNDGSWPTKIIRSKGGPNITE